MLQIIYFKPWGQRRNHPGPWGRRLKVAVAMLILLAAIASAGGRAEAADPVTRGDAYGEQISLKLQTLLATLQVSSGPLSTVSGDTSPFNKDASALSLNVGLGSFGTVLHTGLLLSHTDSASPSQVSSNATVHDLGISLVPVAPLLTLHADEVRSSAVIGGTCGSALTATGSTTLVNAGVGGTLGLGLRINASVPPNTVLLNLLGVRVVLNEQIVGGDGLTSRTINVNAIHISIQNSLLGPLGRLTSDIVIAHSDAQIVCAPPPPPPTPKADLGVTLAAAPNPVTVGQMLTYTLNVSNAGPSVATGTTLSDSLPAGVSFVSAQPSQGSCSGTAVLSCSLGTLAVGGSASVVIQVIPNAAGSLTDTASVTSNVTDPNTANNSASVTVNAVAAPQPMADLSLALSAAPNPVTVGQTLTYTLNVSNAGPSVATGTVLSDSLPAGVSFVSAQPSQGSCSGTATITCSLGTVAVGGNASVVIQVIPNAAGSLTDTASVTSSVADPNAANNSAEVTVNAIIVRGPEADLSLTLTAAPNPVEVGQTLTYTLNVSNAGPSDATGVVLSDGLPAGVSLVSAQPSQGSCTGTATVSCSLGTVPIGGSASVVIQGIPNAAGSLTDTAGVAGSVPDPNPANNNASITVDAVAAPQPMADLSLSLTAAPDPVTVGQTLTYTLTVSNAGPSTATATLLSNALPASVSLVSAQPSQGSCTGTATVSCSLGAVAAGGTASVVIQVLPNTPGCLTDTASVTSAVTDPDTSNNSATATVDAIDVPGEADLAISLGADPDPVETGQILTFFVDVANFGPSDAVGVRLSNVLPAGVSLVSVQPAQGSCTGTTTLSCSLGTIAAGNDVSVEIQVIPNTPGTLTDTASATSSVDDPDTSNNDGAVTVTANGLSADLALNLAANPHPVLVGQILTYTLTVTNAGPSDATDVTLSDGLPAGVTLVSVQPSQGTCSGTACSLGTVAVGGDATVVIQVIPNQAGTLTDIASVTGGLSDPDPSNNNASVTVSVFTGQEPKADLSLTKRASVDHVGLGAQFTYQVTVTNGGPDDATGVVVTDPLPFGVTLISVETSQGDCTGTDTITCNLGGLANGASAVLTLTVQAVGSGNLVNTATVTSTTEDLDDSNNSDSATVNVRPPE